MEGDLLVVADTEGVTGEGDTEGLVVIEDVAGTEGLKERVAVFDGDRDGDPLSTTTRSRQGPPAKCSRARLSRMPSPCRQSR